MYLLASGITLKYNKYQVLKRTHEGKAFWKQKQTHDLILDEEKKWDEVIIFFKDGKIAGSLKHTLSLYSST